MGDTEDNLAELTINGNEPVTIRAEISRHSLNSAGEQKDAIEQDTNTENEPIVDKSFKDVEIETNTDPVEIEIGDDLIIEEQQIQNENDNNSRVIPVEVNEGDVNKTISVKIVDRSPKKPFLGGFRHKLTGVEYLNASCQTFSKKILASTVEKFSRDTQTVATKTYAQQTFNDTSTQMTKPGCYVSDVKDKVMIPGTYVTAEEKEKTKLEKVIFLQSYWRRWISKQYVIRLRKDKQERMEWERKQAEQKAAERSERLRREFERRMKPRTKSDFDLLYAALEKWRQEEMERINANHSGPERKAALVGLLEQETYLIQSIERHRINADQINEEEFIMKTLEKAALPKFWRAYDGKLTEMSTQHTIRARELKELYSSLQMNYLTNDERLDVLLSVKETVKEHHCKLTQELIDLIDREADLLSRKIKNSNLDGLRQRINTLFLQYCKTPLFNPEIARLLKVPQDSGKLRKDIYFCPSCNKYLTSAEFPLASNSKISGRCKKCCSLDNNARLRNDFTKVRCILQHLRQTEEAFNDGSRTAFIIQDADLLYLIENIWNSQSALSGVDDLYELVLIRWNKHEHWAPWNCVLLTKEEASAHMKLENVAEAYGRIFIGKVHHKHVVAKQHFAKLTKMGKQQVPKPPPPKGVNFNRIAGTVSG